MAEALKNVYNQGFFETLLNSFQKVIPTLNRKAFLAKVFTPTWQQLELKARTGQVAEAMKTFLPINFEQAAPLLIQLTEQLEKDEISGRYEHLFIPEYIEKNGLNHEEMALQCIEKVTQFVSCEFAIRPFIMQNQKLAMQQLLKWSKHPNENVRRLASEGCRPRLPWAAALVEFKKKPTPILPILENLKTDTSLYIKKSVANNLNDISKDHPDLFLQIANKWIGKNEHSNWIIKHAARTLLKAGNQKVMALFGYASNEQLKVSKFTVENNKIQLGEQLRFTFSLKNLSHKKLKVRLEYGIYFKKQNGKNNCKVFKISEKNLSPSEKTIVKKSHTIKTISTRRYHEGIHFISLIVNGIELDKLPFDLKL